VEKKIIDCGLRYEIVRLIHAGGMGVVYEAKQFGVREFVKRVAIKVIGEKHAREHPFVEDFIGEARLVADLIHSNIVQTYHLGQSDGDLFIVMELVNGVNLQQLRQQAADLRVIVPRELAVLIASRICRGLSYAHAKSDPDGIPLHLVHRDVCPKNVMVSFEGDVKLSDFGVAKARGFLKNDDAEVRAGKVDYMSPEQADYQPTDPRSDLFSTGVVLAQLLVGYNIFRAETSDACIENIRKLPIPDFCKLSKQIDERLNHILQRALQRDVKQRYQSAGEMLYELEHYIYHAGYGPTNETLGKYVRDLYSGKPAPVNARKAATGNVTTKTRVLVKKKK